MDSALRPQEGFVPTEQTAKPVVSGHTPGPWGWFGSQSGVYLATPDRGRTYVMGFRRMGLQGAQPTFRDSGIMCPASELVRFAVGEGVAKGFAEGRADRSVYRYDISDIDHPDARLIAAAPDLLEALILLEREMVLSGNAESRDYGWLPAITKTRAAIAKATAASAVGILRQQNEPNPPTQSRKGGVDDRP